jgi:hypothetical protein
VFLKNDMAGLRPGLGAFASSITNSPQLPPREKSLFEGTAKSIERECIRNPLTSQIQATREAYFHVSHESQARIAPTAFADDYPCYPIFSELYLRRKMPGCGRRCILVDVERAFVGAIQI